MCSPDCRCYEGENGEIKELWVSYGNEALNPYLKNAGDKNMAYGNETAYPFKWTDDKLLAIRSFKQCYEEVLVPKRKYTGQFQQYVESFFDSGGYDFLINMEQEYDDCSSACGIQLFYLSKDISLGSPTKECVGVALDKANEVAQNIGLVLFLLGVIIIISIVFTFALCSGYEADRSGDIAQVNVEGQAVELSDKGNVDPERIDFKGLDENKTVINNTDNNVSDADKLQNSNAIVSIDKDKEPIKISGDSLGIKESKEKK
uniref:Uncharacterized protein n=2 Tax=Strombidium rassoulzadegani TaxID=1082188 RepID=A0A7S3FW33_9SPIT|mmetsp:Transcript_6702/g.11254  ORF Transcript_6702/g.11254 Transcript_6702/m.11254 type:complete len:260 (+) Transcript_6702:475-1254(+)